MRTVVWVTFVLGVLAACGKVVDNNESPDAAPDPCEIATCECTTATEDADCGTHKYCEVGGVGRTCECVAGYTDGVDGCVFTGLVQDPGFAAAATWTPVNGALLNTSAAGGADPGEASFLPSALCSLGHVKQTFDAPSFRKAEPLVLELNYKNQFDQQNFDSVNMGVSFNGGWGPLPAFQDSNYHSLRICLSEGGYAPAATTGKGAPVTLALGPYLPPNRCPNSMINNFAIDHAAIVKANVGECGPMPGVGANADAEGAGGWTSSLTGSSSFAFVNGIGVGGTKAARVTLGARCDSASMETFISVPNVANPALDMFVGTNAGALGAKIQFGTSVFGLTLFSMLPPPAGTSGTIHTCLPPSLRGQTAPLRFAMDNIASGSCADLLNLSLFADNVKVVDDPSCASNDNFVNNGFEQGGVAFGSFGTIGSSTASAVVRTSALLAHSGMKYLALESNGRCSNAGYTMLPTVPASVGASGPAITFFANVGNNPNASSQVRSGVTTQTLTEGNGYQKYTVCLNPLFVGRPQVVTISHDGGSGLCDNSNYVQQNAFIDDIEVTTDPSCPAQ